MVTIDPVATIAADAIETTAAIETIEINRSHRNNRNHEQRIYYN